MSHHSAFSLLFHAYPRPSPNSPYARSKNCIYHRYIYSPHQTRLLQFSLLQHRRHPNRLKAIQNALARAVTKTPKHHHITPVLKQLHWLKIPERIEYKVISLTYNTLQSSQPSVVHHPTTPFNPILIHSNTTPPFCHLVTEIFQSLHSRSCPASLEQTTASILTNI